MVQGALEVPHAVLIDPFLKLHSMHLLFYLQDLRALEQIVLTDPPPHHLMTMTVMFRNPIKVVEHMAQMIRIQLLLAPMILKLPVLLENSCRSTWGPEANLYLPSTMALARSFHLKNRPVTI